MKIKKIEIVRLPFDVETNNPIVARLIVMTKIFRLVSFVKIQPMLFDKPACKPFYRLYIPKIRYIKIND